MWEGRLAPMTHCGIPTTIATANSVIVPRRESVVVAALPKVHLFEQQLFVSGCCRFSSFTTTPCSLRVLQKHQLITGQKHGAERPYRRLMPS